MAIDSSTTVANCLGRLEMDAKLVQIDEKRVLQSSDLQHLFDDLVNEGFQIVGPTVRDGAIVYDHIDSIVDLPTGVTEIQEGGSYRLQQRDDEKLFGYALGPHSWKKYLHPPAVRLWQACVADGTLEISTEDVAPVKQAFIGVRPCELQAISILDEVLLQGPYVDSVYLDRREATFVIAVNCSQAGGTCFCTSMNSGPGATFGFDLCLTEILDDQRHEFVVQTGTERGANTVSRIPSRLASEDDLKRAERVVATTAGQIKRSLDVDGLKELLYRNYEHPRWGEVATRCLMCGNCTMVCPTCFCTTVEDHTDLTGKRAERWRKWDSCFHADFSQIHGGTVRASPKSRYRQWLTHKLATWHDQFGSSGCVGCGRCITWCPVGIDLTEEVAAIRASEPIRSAGDGGNDGNT